MGEQKSATGSRQRTASNNARQHSSVMPPPATSSITAYDGTQVTIATVNGGTGKPSRFADPASNATSTVSKFKI